ncbi:MAG: polyprenyl synthetase family protein [Acidobacteria bacterium]|nr:polyprenyl synthetase family protein [Acidobacteriota bacterium]
MTDLDEYLRARRTEIESALDRYLPSPPACPPSVAGAMRYSVFAGGKRLRPVLTLAAAEAAARHAEQSVDAARRLAMPAACAVEMIHTYSLVHDDLPAMDDDSLRRGRPTSHVVHGEGLAILAGDALQAEAFGLLAREPDASEPAMIVRRLQVLGVVAGAAGAAGMVGGQALDLEASRPPPGRAGTSLDVAALEGMHARKTGALIRAAAAAGAIVAGADDDLVGSIDTYAAEAGLAFQIVDDILDVEGHSDALGKTPGKDEAAGKLTYSAFYGVARSRELAHACLARAEEALRRAGLGDSRLADIARWIVTRDR